MLCVGNVSCTEIGCREVMDGRVEGHRGMKCGKMNGFGVGLPLYLDAEGFLFEYSLYIVLLTSSSMAFSGVCVCVCVCVCVYDKSKKG